MPDSFPIKAVVYTSSRIALPLISALHARGNLGGVVIGGNRSPEESQLVAELQNQKIAYEVFQPDDTGGLLRAFQRWEINLGLCFSFSRILPSVILQSAEFGTYNLHPSALPAYRGPMPIFWQIKHGVHSSALCLHHATQEIDAGNLVIQQPLSIHSLDTFSSLVLAIAGQAPTVAMQLLEMIAAIGHAPAGEAQCGALVPAPMPIATDVIVDWQAMTPTEIQNCARACNGFCGGATFYWRNIPLALLQVTPVDAPTHGTKPGTVVMLAEPEGLVVAARDGAVRLDVISTAEGIFGGVAFAERFGLDAGVLLDNPINNL